MKKAALGLALCLFFLFLCAAIGRSEEPAKLLYFYSPACKQCLQVKNEFLPQIRREFADRLKIEEYDIGEVESYKLLLGIKKSSGATISINVPLFYLKGNFLEGARVNKENLRYFILSSLAGTFKEGALRPAGVNLAERFQSFSLLAVLGAGLIDGINPCAFTVIAFFISFLALQGYRKRELVVIGFSFILAVFITYLLIGLGIFNFLYRLEGFWLAAKIIGITIGLLSIALGLGALADFFKFRKTGSTERMFLKLPAAVNRRIHSVIGLYHRKREEEPKPGIARLTASALASGFLVSLLEAVCTGQVYLPTIVFVLKAAPLKPGALAALLAYNLMFIIPLIGVFLAALFGVSSAGFAKFMKRHLGLIKIAMAFLFFLLGAFLISSYAEPAAQNLAREEKEEDAARAWNFGRAKEGKVLIHKFEFRNTRKTALKIENITTSCGCTVSQAAKKELAPNEATLIEVKFDTKGYSGPTKQFVYLATDDPEEPVARFTVEADVAKGEK